MKKNLFHIALILIMTSGCTSAPKRPNLSSFTSIDCQNQFEKIPLKKPLETLDKISNLFDLGCNHEVIALGHFVRKSSRDKVYHVFAETLELATPEGSLTEYTLETHERAYLSFLLASSYHRLGKDTASLVEIRKGHQEGKALLYNFGEDPINSILQATFFDNHNQASVARPFWKRAQELLPKDHPAQAFIEARINEIDGHLPSRSWNIHALGQFPELTWKINFNRNRGGGYYDISNTESFPTACSTSESLMIPTEIWMKPIEDRYQTTRHPLLNAKAWTRLPVGLTYGFLTATSGLIVAIGGCGTVAALTNGADGTEDLCKPFLYAGGALIKESGNVTSYTLKPDLRHWKTLPSAIVITSSKNPSADPCWSHSAQQQNFRPLMIQEDI